jgi:hypothetical protein
VSVMHHPPGHLPQTCVPGDFFLVCDWTEDLLGKLIRAGERTRFGNTDYARWSHSGMIETADGGIIEANQPGIQRANISKYRDADLYVVGVEQPTDRRALAVGFAELQVGSKYDVLDFVALAFQCIFGVDFSLHTDRRFICSGLVSRATEKYIDAYPRSSEAMMPADLADYWKVTSGQPLPKLGWFDRLLNLIAGIGRIVTFRDPVKPQRTTPSRR